MITLTHNTTQNSLDIFIDDLIIKRPEFDVSSIVTYGGRTKPLKLLCLSHDTQELKQAKFLLGGSNCPVCARATRTTKTKTSESTFVEKLRKTRPELSNITILLFTGTTEPLTFSCSFDGHDDTTISEARALLRKGNCKTCSAISKSQKLGVVKTGLVAHNKGVPMASDQKQKLREKALERYEDSSNHPMYGKHHSDETKLILSEHSRNAAGTEMAHLRTVSGIQTRRDRGDDLAFFRGRSHSEESKEKISTSSKRNWDERAAEMEALIIERAKMADITVLEFLDEDRYWLSLQCDKCSHEFEFTKQMFIPSKFKKEVCPKCFPREVFQSKGEREVGEYVESLGFTIDTNNDTLLRRQGKKRGLELDIYIPEAKLAIEYGGLYWHSMHGGNAGNMYPAYHRYKLDRCEKLGITLITIFEDEWIHTPEIVKSLIATKLNKTPISLYARKCTVGEINAKEARGFIDKYHLQGYTSSSIKVGLFFDESLVSVATFSRPSNAKGGKGKDYWELSRMCSSLRVIGGAGKLLNYFKTKYDPPTLVSFADRRWFTGGVYEKLGFVLDDITPPNYWYISGTKRIHRYNLRKGMVATDDPNLKEFENRRIQGWDWIWDCGNYRFEWRKP